MANIYDYLKPYVHLPKEDESEYKVLTAPFNSFGPLFDNELEEGEEILGQQFPAPLEMFYQEIGVGHLMVPHITPTGYYFGGSNEILPPIAAANFSKGILFWEGQRNYMAEDAYEDLQPGDLPFFEIFDSSKFLIMKLNSDNPNAVWRHKIKITDSFDEFIWRLYYESPDFYDDIILDYYK